MVHFQNMYLFYNPNIHTFCEVSRTYFQQSACVFAHACTLWRRMEGREDAIGSSEGLGRGENYYSSSPHGGVERGMKREPTGTSLLVEL